MKINIDLKNKDLSMFVWKSQYHTDVSSFKNDLQYNALIRKFQTEFNGIYESEFEYSKSGKYDWYNCVENIWLGKLALL